MFNGSQFITIERARFRTFINDLWIYQHCANSFGLFGNLVIVVTLFSAHSMGKSRYNSYRCLHVAELLFNIAYWTEAINNSAFGRKQHASITFSHYENAFVKIAAKFVYSCVTYTCMYMAILAGIDRCFALWFPSKYENIKKKHIVINVGIFVSVLIAASVNSWGAFYRWEVTQSDMMVHINHTIQQYWVEKYARTGFEHDAYESMNLYNSAIRITCCIVIILSTAFAMVGFKRVERMKRLLLIDVRYDQSMVVRRGTAVLRREKADNSLYWLMILIAGLGIGQVLPGELARLVKAHYNGRPEYNINTCLAVNDEQCLRLTVFTGWLTMFANFLVVLMRNVKFYLYMMLHAQMREEVSKVFAACCVKDTEHFDEPVCHADPCVMKRTSVLEDMQPLQRAPIIDPVKLHQFNGGAVRFSITTIDEIDKAVYDFRASRESCVSISHSNSNSNRSKYDRSLREDSTGNTIVPVKQWRALTPVDYLRDRSGSTASERCLNRQLLIVGRNNKRHSIDLVQKRSRSEDVLL